METQEKAKSTQSIRGFLLMAIFLFFLTIGIHNYSIGSALSEFNDVSIKALLVHVIVSVLFQLLILGLAAVVLSKLVKSRGLRRNLFSLLAALTLVLNVFLLFIAHIDPIMGAKSFVKFGVFFGLLFMSFTFLKTFFDKGITRYIFATLSVAFCIYSIFPFIASGDEGETSTADVTPLGPKIPGSRNIYFVSFDSMIPRTLSKYFLDIDSPAYMDVLDDNNARTFRNSFAGFVTTKAAMNSMLQLDPDVYDRLRRDDRFVFFSGTEKSTLTKVFHERGYKVQTMYKTEFFGNKKGPYIDHYGIPSSRMAPCSHVVNNFVFLGYCHSKLNKITQPFLKLVGADIGGDEEPYIDFFLRRIKKTAAQDQPWFTMTHIYMPGHTKIDFRFDNPEQIKSFSKEFEERSIEAASDLQRVMDFIKENDPTGILLTYGDHGALVSRGMELAMKKNRLPVNEDYWRDFVWDEYGINIAVWPGDLCKEDLDQFDEVGMATSSQVGRAVIKCATNGVDPLTTNPEYPLPVGRKITRARLKYEDYLYE